MESISKLFDNVGELAQIALQSQSEALDSISKRAQDSITELRALLPRSK